MWRARGRTHRSTGVAMTGLDEIFHPEAARAREFIEVQHEMVVPLPGAGTSPGTTAGSSSTCRTDDFRAVLVRTPIPTHELTPCGD